MLSKKVNYPTIVKYLQDKGIKISNVSVGRHNNNHRLASKATKKKSVKKKTTKKRAKGKASQTSFGDHNKVNENRNLAAFERDLAEVEKRRKKVLKNIANISQDIDVIEKIALTVQLAEDRLFRAIEEEHDTKMVLTVTSGAFKDHLTALKHYHEITAGLDSATQLRFAQMVNLVGNVFVGQPMSDKARHDMLEMMTEHDLNAVPEPPDTVIVEAIVSNSKTKVVTIDASKLSSIGDKPKSKKDKDEW